MRSPVRPILLDQRTNPEHIRQQVALPPRRLKLVLHRCQHRRLEGFRFAVEDVVTDTRRSSAPCAISARLALRLAGSRVPGHALDCSSTSGGWWSKTPVTDVT